MDTSVNLSVHYLIRYVDTYGYVYLSIYLYITPSHIHSSRPLPAVATESLSSSSCACLSMLTCLSIYVSPPNTPIHHIPRHAQMARVFQFARYLSICKDRQRYVYLPIHHPLTHSFVTSPDTHKWFVSSSSRAICPSTEIYRDMSIYVYIPSSHTRSSHPQTRTNGSCLPVRALSVHL